MLNWTLKLKRVFLTSELKYTIKHTKNIFDNNDIVVVVFTVTKKPVLDLSDTTNGNVLLDKIYVSPITNA